MAGTCSNPWSSTSSFITQSGGGGGGGCPYVSTLNDGVLVPENNILPQSEYRGNAGIDVTDYYKTLKPPALLNGRYTLEITEFEHERSRLDQFQLIAVDHDPLFCNTKTNRCNHE